MLLTFAFMLYCVLDVVLTDEARKAELAELLTREEGKTLAESTGEVQRAAAGEGGVGHDGGMGEGPDQTGIRTRNAIGPGSMTT
jgi:acyl-CoA reductase-like NAD-dependent aldehyde dehydrogenase